MQNPIQIRAAAARLKELLPGRILAARPVGVVLGTGLGAWAESGLDGRVEIPYSDIPGFPRSTVASHHGRLVAGLVGGRGVLALQGRFHLYEGYSPAEVCMGVRVLAELGARILVLTNAAGSLNPLFEVGGLMLISDQINFTGRNPLAGLNEDAWGPRFPDMCRVYPPAPRSLAMAKALELGLRLEQGVYLGVTGPCLETPAETRAFRILGADAVGMSTVLEAIAARHMGLELLGLSCLTNQNLPDAMTETSLEQVIAQAAKASGRLASLLAAVIPAL